MPLNAKQISELAEFLDQATTEAREVERLTVRYPDLSLEDAYLIQDAGVRLRLKRGEKQTGLKMGLTSEAKRKQMNLKSPVYGVLTDRMRVEEGGQFSLKGKIHPRIEPEIAFLVSRELRGRPDAREALAACSGVCAAMEIIDSRYVGFKYFSLPDVVADNSSSSYFVLGRTILPPDGADWSRLGMRMEADGHPAQVTTSDAISGGPVNSLVQLCALLDERGLGVPAGSIVLAGAATQAVALTPGCAVKLEVEKLGAVTLHAAG